MSTIEVTDEDGYAIEITDAPGATIDDAAIDDTVTWSAAKIIAYVDSIVNP